MANLADIFAQADYDQSIAGVASDESQLQETAQTQKLIDLQNKALEKVEALSKKTGGLGIPPPLTTGKGLNTASAAELQQALSDAIDQQIYTDPQGNKYQERYTQDAQGNTVITKVPYTTKNKYGSIDAENLYIDTTKEGNYKLGLARPDKGFMGRYTDTDGNPNKGYGWAPGPRGVTPENGALLDVTLPYDTATQLEYFVHSNKEQIRNRPFGTVPVPKGSQIEKAYGSGKTEYTTPNAPMWNQNYDPKSVDAQITKDTPLPKELKGILPALSGNAYEDAKARLRAGNEKFLGPKTQTEVKTVGDVLDRVKFALKGRESGGDYKAVNDYGYAGAYQIGGEVLEGLGMVKPGTKTKDLWRPEVWTGKYGVRSRGDFLNNKDLQDKLMDQHLQGLYKQVSGNATDLQDLAGKVSAAHLLGVKGSQNLEKKDAYGTSGNEYYKLGVDALGIKQKYINAMRNAPERREEGSIGNTLKGMIATIPAVAENILKAPSSLYNALGGDYLEKGSSFEKERPTWASATKAVINTLKDASQYVHAFNTDVIGYDPGAMEQLQKDVGKAFDEKRYVTGVLGAIVDNPLGAVDLGVSSYGFAKAMTASGLKGFAATPAILGSFSDNMEKSVEIFRKEYGREPVGDEMAAIAGLSTIGTALDTVAAHKIFNSARGDIASKAIGEAIDTLIDKVPTTVAKVALKNVQKVGAYMAIEGLQEAGTEATTILGGTQDWDKFTKPEHMKAVFTAGATGGIAGPGMKATDIAGAAAGTLGNAALSKDARDMMIDVIKNATNRKGKTTTEGTSDYSAVQTNVSSMNASTGDLKSAMDTVASYREGVSTLADEGMLDTETEAKYASNVKTIVDSFDKASDETPMTFGSKAGTVNFLSTVIEEKSKGNNGILDAEVEKKLAKIATANGISNDEFKHIKNMANVEQEATLGKRGYISQFNKLVALMENPEENKKAINKTYKQMLGFRDTQVQFAKNLEAAIKEASAFVAQNKDREKQGLSPLKAKQFEAVMEVEGARKNKHKFVVNATEQGLAAARQVLAKKHQNIEGLSEGLRFYNTQLGAAGVDTELSTKVIVPEKLANFGKLADKHNITKVITNNTSRGLSKQLNEMQGNASRINNKEYSSDDTVVIDLTSIDKKDLKVRDIKGHKRYLLPDSVAEQIWAAKKAGASIILHRGKADPAISRAVEGYLRQQYGGDKDAKYGALLDNKNKFGPLDVITEKNKDVTSKREEDEKKKKHQHDLKVAYAKTLIKPNDEDLKTALKEQFEINKGYFAASEEKSSQEKMEAFVEGQINKLVKEMLTKMIETGKSHGKEIHVEGGFAEIVELAGQKYMEYKDTIQEVSGVLEEWKKIEADPENELTFGEWLGKQEGIEAASVATHILDNSVSNELDSRVFKQKYKKDKEDKTELLSERTSKTRLDEKVHTNGIVEYERGIDVPLNKYVTVKKEGTVFNSIPIEGLGETINSLVDTWEKYFFGEKGFTAVSFGKDTGGRSFTKDDYALMDSPARGVFLTKDSNGDAVVNRNVIAAAITAMYEAISLNSYMMSNKEWKPEEDIKRLHGLKEGQYLSHDSVSTLSRQGILRKTLAEDIGKGMAKLLGLTPLSDSKSDKEQFDRLVADLGHYAMLAGVMSGHLHLTKMSMEQYGKLLGKDDNEFAKDLGAIDIGFVHIKEEDLDDREENSTTKVAVIKRKFDMLVEELPEVSTMRKEPSTKPISKRVKEKLKGSIRKDKSGFVPAKEAQEALKHLMNQGYKVNGALIDKVLEYKDAIKTKLGFIELGGKEYEDLSKDKKDVQEAINRDIEKSIEELEVLKGKLSEDINEQEKFRLFFEWYYTKNGRYMMDSNTINPQTDKQLHRFIVTPEQHESNYTLNVDDKTKNVTISLANKDELPKGVKEEEIHQNFLYAMAQAFGIGVDKKSTAMFEEKMQLVLNNYKELDIDKMEKDVLTTDAKEVPFVTKDGNPLELNGKEVKFEIEHLAHMLQAFQALRAMQAGEQFSTSLTAETDAVTSGFALKLMQMPIIGKSLRYLLKVGIFPKVLLEEGALEHPAVKAFLDKDKDFENELLSIIEEAKKFDKDKAISMNDILGSGVMKDSYQTLGVDMVDIKPVSPTDKNGKAKDHSGFSNGKVKEKLLTNKDNAWGHLKKILPSYDVAKGTVDSELRSLFKAPFMTFNYSASITNIRKHLASNLVDGLFEKIMDVNDKDAMDLFEKVFKPLNIDDVKKNDLTSLRELLKTTNSFMLKAPGISNVRNELEHLMNITYGAKLEEVMTAQFEEFIKAQDVVNTSFNLMFQVYNAHLQDRVDKVIKANGVITLANMKEIEKGLQKLFPSIKGPLSDVNSQEDLDRIGIIGFGKGSGAGPMAPQTHLSENGKKKYDQNTMKIQYTIKQFAAAVSAGSVVPIHYIDGALMGKLINAMSKIYGGSAGVTAIHDAIMPALVMLGLASRTYNEGVLDVAENFNFIEEVFKSVEKSKDSIGEFGGTPVYGAKILGKVVEKTTIAEMVKMLMEGNEKENVKGLQELVSDVQAARKMLKELVDVSGAYVMHLASTKNGVYEYEGKAEVKQNKGSITEITKTKEDIINELKTIISNDSISTAVRKKLRQLLNKSIKESEDC